ncbi:UNVERIFIED_CONTAM: 7-hydroxymethyl chlorophyll a reductase, chloroplastic [Sesamum angustifolium]|uniref:7-hydroxymethyl chlorophyll a reductase, chloroplastic n=1 Tax=Sesamum angustifolium TaxID=2727405 RepID=A0AAW2NZR3_9LAMI
MASAQVLRKQEHLEAGKKKLEEFRRKKAAERAKKTTSTSQVHASDGVIHQKQPSEIEHVRLTDANGVGTSDALADGRLEPSGFAPKVAIKESDISIKSDISSSSDKNVTPSPPSRHNDINSSVLEHSNLNNEDYKDAASVGSDGFRTAKDIFQIRKDDYGSSSQVSSGVGNDHFVTHQAPSSQENHTSSHSTYHDLDNYPSNNIDDPEKIFHMKLSGSDDYMGSVNQSYPWTSDNRYADYNSDARSSSSHAPSSPPAAGRRNRPSFLDSIQITKGPLSSPPLFGAEKADMSKPKVFPVDGLESSGSQRSANSSVAAGDGVGLFNHVSENKYDFFPSKQNDDFAALEQHIEDLTQEKFSLQRALEASRALAESLASENSALTESFNQQGSVVNQLKFDLEILQQEIKTQLVELEAVKREYANAQMECNAADERAKLLASEVIELEEKALRLRSNELKLERQLENTQAEISSYRKKMASLDKDRQDLQSTIDALQEEKKLLQSKLRKASSSGNSIDLSKTSRPKHDVSTSTEDLESGNSENLGTALPGDDAPSSQVSHESIHFSLEVGNRERPVDTSVVSRIIPKLPAFVAVLNSLRFLIRTELNKELTRKLEAQTQRLELLTAQSMVNDNTQPRQLDPRAVHENTTYADEGDEVEDDELYMAPLLFVSNKLEYLLPVSYSVAMAMASGILSSMPFSLSILSASSTEGTSSKSVKLRDDWRQKSRPVPPGGSRTSRSWSRQEIDSLDEAYMGVYEDLLYARKTNPVEGAQWTGIVTTIAMEMLRSGMVEAVVCVQSDPDDRFTPRPILARTPEEVLAAKGVKPTLSPNLNTLALIEAAGVKRLLFCGVGCQVQALRSVEHHLNLEKLYVLGTNCVDNGTREGLDKFLKAASTDPETVLHYEFMQDYKVHLKHLDGHIEEVPYFCLPANELTDVIAPSCYSCFDYTNALADMVVGYMGVPKYSGLSMTQHPQYVTIRNERGKEMLNLVKDLLEITPTISSGDRRPFVMETVKADDKAKLGKGPSQTAPKFIGDLIAFILNLIGPKGLEFARYSLDYHTIRNYLHVNRAWGKQRADRHIPSYAKKLVSMYNQNGEIDQMLSAK